MAVRTKELVTYELAAGDNEQDVYTCPALTTAIIKDVRITNASGASCLVGLAIKKGGATPVFHFILESVLSVTTLKDEGAFVVMEPDDVLYFGVGDHPTGPIRLAVYGAELDGVA